MKKKARKDMIVIVCIFIFLPLIVWCCTFGVWYGRNALAEVTIRRLVREIASFEKRNSRLPAKLNEIEECATLHKCRIYGIFTSNDLFYEVSSNGYRLYYYVKPLGPFEGYDSVSHDWFAEE